MMVNTGAARSLMQAPKPRGWYKVKERAAGDAGSGRAHRPTAADVQPRWPLTEPVDDDPLFDRSDDTLQRLKLRSQHDDAGPCIDRQPRVLFVRHDRAQFVDPGVALRRHQPELGQMRTQGVDDLGALAYQHIARAMLHQLTLLFGRFDRTKRMVGRRTASQIASASAASFLLRLT